MAEKYIYEVDIFEKMLQHSENSFGAGVLKWGVLKWGDYCITFLCLSLQSKMKRSTFYYSKSLSYKAKIDLRKRQVKLGSFECQSYICFRVNQNKKFNMYLQKLHFSNLCVM